MYLVRPSEEARVLSTGSLNLVSGDVGAGRVLVRDVSSSGCGRGHGSAARVVGSMGEFDTDRVSVLWALYLRAFRLFLYLIRCPNSFRQFGGGVDHGVVLQSVGW